MLIQKLKIILKSNILVIILILLILIKCVYKINSKYDINTKEIIGIITKIKKSDKLELTVKSKENIKVYYFNELDVKLGDKVKIVGDLKLIESNTIFNLFNYKEYMLSKNIYYSMKCKNITIIKKNTNILYKIKNKLINKLNTLKGYNYLNLFILGDNQYIDSAVKESYRTNGIIHIFSVSGMHVSLIVSVLLFILNKIKKRNMNYFLVILILLFYVFLTGFYSSVIRATFLFIFIYLNKLFNLNISTKRILILIFLFTLFLNPYNLYNSGYLFSYSISFTLICMNKYINKYKGYIKKLLITSLISFMISIPLLINSYFFINVLSIFNNLIFIPLISLIIFPFSFIILIFNKLNFIYVFLINILESLSLFISKYKIEIVLSHIDIKLIIVYYIIIILILYKFLKKKYLYILILFIMLFIHANINNIIRKSYATFLDVGQGDSTLLHFSSNKNILIDTGGKKNYALSKNLITYLKSKGIIKLDYLILTHGDYDHMGEAINLVENFKVGNVILNCGEYNNLEKALINVLEQKKIKYYSCIKELNIAKYKLQFLNTGIYDNENDNSNVVYFNYRNYKFLFMGDAGIQRENDILDKYNLKNIDFLKVGHHGSNTSSSEKFINSINPKSCLISVGKNNIYGHPKESVLDILDDYCDIYRTDLNGSVEIKLKRNNYKIKTVN